MSKCEWIWLENTVVLVADTEDAARAEYNRFMVDWPNNTLYESTSGYDSDGKRFRVIFWRSRVS